MYNNLVLVLTQRPLKICLVLLINFNGFLCCVIGRRKITNNKLIGLLFIKLLPIDYNMYKVQEYDSTKGFKGLIFMSDNNINHPHPRSY